MSCQGIFASPNQFGAIQYEQPPPTKLSGTQTALVFGGLGVFAVAIIALQFYKASKGITDTFVVSDDHHHDHHSDHRPGLTFAFNRRSRKGRRHRGRARRNGPNASC